MNDVINQQLTVRTTIYIYIYICLIYVHKVFVKYFTYTLYGTSCTLMSVCLKNLRRLFLCVTPLHTLVFCVYCFLFK